MADTNNTSPALAPALRLEMKTDNGHGHAIVSNYSVCSYSGDYPEEPKMRTGHVWAEIQCGMGVNRINVTPAEARRIAAMLVEVADAMDAVK